MIQPQDYRAAMCKLGAAVNIITTDGPAGRHGMTASAVCSVSDEPASLLVCINRSARLHAIVQENGRLTVNVLSSAQSGIALRFADSKVSSRDRFASGTWEEIGGGFEGLERALAVFGCSVKSAVDVGTHTVFLCSVEQLRVGDVDEALMYFDRSFHQLSLASMANGNA